MQDVFGWRLERLIMFREWSFDHQVAGKQPPDALGVHDERSDGSGRLYRRRVIGNVDTGPFRAIPFDDGLGRIPGLALEIGTGAIVKNSPIGRPCPSPVRSDALLARIG